MSPVHEAEPTRQENEMSEIEWTDAEEVAAHEAVRRVLGPEQPRTADLITSRVLKALAPHRATWEAQAAARALRGAADAVDLSGHFEPGYLGAVSVECRNAEGSAESWLRERADRIERGES